MFPPAPQDSHRKPDEDPRQPRHESRRVEALLGQPIFSLIKAHALEGGGHDDKKHRDLRRREPAKNPLAGGVVFFEQPMHCKQQRQDERGYGHELEEPTARVLRVGQPRRHLDQLGASKKITELDHDEAKEEGVERAQHDRHLDHPERRELEAPRERKFPFLSEQRPAQEPGDNPGAEGHEEEVRDDFGKVQVERLSDDSFKDRVRRDEESSEQKQQRDGEEKPAPDGDRAF